MMRVDGISPGGEGTWKLDGNRLLLKVSKVYVPGMEEEVPEGSEHDFTILSHERNALVSKVEGETVNWERCSNSAEATEELRELEAAIEEADKSQPQFQLQHAVEYETDFWGRSAWVDNFYLLNNGSAAAKVEWIGMNDREECLAVPILGWGNEGIIYFKVPRGDGTEKVAEALDLRVGQKIQLKTGGFCGTPVKLSIRANGEDYEIDPAFN